MNTYTIYMHKNKINGKIYIGQTCQKPEYRWNHGEGYKQCSAFYAAIQKYGWDNFEHIILKENLSCEEANIEEQKLIKEYKSNEKQFGYNIQQGGNNHNFNDEGKEKCHKHVLELWQDPEHKRKMSLLMKEKWKDPDNRKKITIKIKAARQKHYEETGSKSFLTEEGRKAISEARKKYIAKNGTPTQGKGHTKETREKISKSMMGEKNPMYGKHHTEEWKKQISEKSSKKIKCIETGEIFSSYQEAAKWAGLKSSSGISDYFAGKKKSAGKHPVTNIKLHWEKIENG